MNVARTVARCTKARRFEQKGDAWYSTDIATNCGHGRFDEAEALAHHHRLIGFAALKKLGYPESETHDFDWHLWPTDTPLAFVEEGVRQWQEVAAARAAMEPFTTLINAVLGRAA